MNLLNNFISHEQRKKIFAMSRQAGLSNEELHGYMREWADAHSLSGNLCSGFQANKIITSLEAIINKRKINFSHPKRNVANPKGPTEKQLNAINTLKKILKWNDARLAGFARHTVDKSEINSLTVIEASKLITGLRKMLPCPNNSKHNKNYVTTN